VTIDLRLHRGYFGYLLSLTRWRFCESFYQPCNNLNSGGEGFTKVASNYQLFSGTLNNVIRSFIDREWKCSYFLSVERFINEINYHKDELTAHLDHLIQEGSLEGEIERETNAGQASDGSSPLITCKNAKITCKNAKITSKGLNMLKVKYFKV
jgi:hypothetical protein